MDVIFWEWAGAMVRWLHIVAGIAWIEQYFTRWAFRSQMSAAG